MNAAPGERSLLIASLRAWLQQLESGAAAEVPGELLEQLSGGDQGFYREVAGLTLRLHRAVAELRLDERLARMTGDAIPDARDRLQYVVKMTEDAAHRTLDLVDGTRGIAADLVATAQRLGNADHQLSASVLPAACDRQSLHKLLAEERARLDGNAALLRTRLNDMASAQEYQDITGQIIKRVIALVEDVDLTLAQLLSAHDVRLKTTGARPIPSQNEALPGPALPGRPAANQQDADALLDSLGF